jgi:uncharacterized membrane protein
MPSHTRSLPTALLMRAGMAVLFVVGALAVLVRGAYPADAAQQLEPLRVWLLRVFALSDPAAAQRAAQVAHFDAPFAAHPVATALHLGAALLWLLLTPFQLSDRVRAARPGLHRAGGRLVLLAGGVLALSGLYFGIGGPFAGWREAVVVSLVSVWFCTATVRAVRAIRQGDVPCHRRWMLRAFAVPLGVTVIRLVGMVLELTLVGTAVGAVTRFLLSLWVGWPLTVGAMEAWLWHTAQAEQQTTSLARPRRARVA